MSMPVGHVVGVDIASYPFRTATMADLFRGVASRHPTRDALIADGLRLTFRELDERTDTLAAALLDRGIGRGSTVGTLLVNGLAMVELLIATAKLGATVLTMNWRLSSGELRFIVNDADPQMVFVSDRFEQLAADADPERPRLVIPEGDPGGALAALVEGDVNRLGRDHMVEATDRWYLLYTSGTTGRPKGCQHSQGGFYVNALSTAGWCGLRDSDRSLLGASNPLFHVSGLINFLTTYSVGACTVVQPLALDIEAVLRFVCEHRITVQSIPIQAPDQYLDLQEELQLPLQLRMIIGGGAMHQVRYLARVRDVLHADMTLVYGQSEVGGYTSCIRLAEQLERPASCGKVLPHLEARIVDEEGHDVENGVRGELLVRGPAVAMGYLNLPAATAETIEDGWLHSGDMFWRDDDGYLYLVGRRKELVKTGGENVYPAEVEQILDEHPSIVESCIVGVPDKKWGEAVKAFVVLSPGASMTPPEVATWVRRSIAGYKRPRYVEFLDAIPRNFQGKAHRAELAARPVTPEQSSDA